jgi:hypothetical protein
MSPPQAGADLRPWQRAYVRGSQSPFNIQTAKVLLGTYKYEYSLDNNLLYIVYTADILVLEALMQAGIALFRPPIFVPSLRFRCRTG